jgi:hypothetical protein
MIDDECGAVGGMRIGRGDGSVTLFTTNPTWPDLLWNPDRRGGKPATNSLSSGTALKSTNKATVSKYFYELSPVGGHCRSYLLVETA